MNKKEFTQKKYRKGSKMKEKAVDFKDKDCRVKGFTKSEAGIPEKNDWKFYAASDEIARDVASIPFNYLGGTPFRISGNYIAEGGDEGDELITKALGGSPLVSVMSLDYINSIGVTDQQTQGVNMAATQLYTFIRHANSGAKNYEAADVMMYILAMRDIYADFFELKKILGCANIFNYYNHNLPDLLIKAHGIEPNDLRNNIAQYRGALNLIAKKINSFAVPKYFKVFDRSAYINSFIFGDSSSMKGQFYIFNKAGYYTWSGTASQQGTSLVFHEHPTTLVTFQDRLDSLNEMLDALFLDEDALTMSGDILKAFSESDLYAIAQTDDQYTTSITMDEDILAQIENSTIFGFGENLEDLAYYDFNVRQKDQLITFKPTITTGTNDNVDLAMSTLCFNSHKDNPTYTDVLEWTRLMCTFTSEGEEGDKELSLTSSGLEIILQYNIFKYDLQGQVQTIPFANVALNTINPYVINFDWHPFIYVVINPGNKIETATEIVPAGDVKVPTTISYAVLERINEAAVYGAMYGSNLYNNKR